MTAQSNNPLLARLRRIDHILRPQGHVFYGWYIVFAGGGIQMLAGLLWMQSYGAYVVLLQHDFGWSKALVAGAFALSRIEAGLLGPLQGYLVDRYGPRAMLRVGIVIFGIGFLLFSRIDSLFGFYFAFALIAMGTAFGGFQTVMVAVVNWFSRHRSKAVALSQIGGSLGGVCVPLIVLSLEGFGWRTTALLSGIAVLAVGLPAAQMVKHRPAEIGETPDGTLLPAPSGDGNDIPAASPRDFTAREALRTRAFWFISFGHASALLVVSAVMVHLVPHLTEDLHYSLAGAGLVVSLLTVCQMLGQVSGGYLGDKFNKQVISTFCMVSHAVGLLMVAYATNLWMVLGFTLLHGLAWGIRGPLMVAMRADYFGASSFGTIMGFSSMIIMVGMSAGPVLAGYLADIYGNYEMGFTILAAGAFLGSFCFMAATPPQRLQD